MVYLYMYQWEKDKQATPLSGPTVTARFIERTVAERVQVQLAAMAVTTMGWVSG